MLMFDCIVIPSFGVFYLIFRVRLRARENLSGKTGRDLIGHRRDEKNLFRDLGYKYQDYWKSKRNSGPHLATRPCMTWP
jgi:hypothetical protein